MIVKELRLKKGWSQEHLSEVSGLSTRTIQRIESGHEPSLESLLSLASSLEVNVETLQSEEVVHNQKQKTTHSRSTRRFYRHLIKFGLIVSVLFVVNYMNNPDYIWAWWVVFGWGIGISIHALNTFNSK